MRNQLYDENIGEGDELGQYGRRQRGAAVMDGRSGMNRIRRMPYDYVARFPLTGRSGRKVNAVINISAEAWFICTSIGYSLEEPEIVIENGNGSGGVTIFNSSSQRNGDTPPNILTLTRSNKRLNLLEFLNSPTTVANSIEAIQGSLLVEQLIAQQTHNLREALSFTYAIIDKGSGRELQNEPIHNLAGLGKANGERPFRELVVPYVFAPNSSILIEINEILTLAGGTIHMDFQGYKEFR